MYSKILVSLSASVFFVNCSEVHFKDASSQNGDIKAVSSSGDAEGVVVKPTSAAAPEAPAGGDVLPLSGKELVRLEVFDKIGCDSAVRTQVTRGRPMQVCLQAIYSDGSKEDVSQNPEVRFQAATANRADCAYQRVGGAFSIVCEEQPTRQILSHRTAPPVAVSGVFSLLGKEVSINTNVVPFYFVDNFDRIGIGTRDEHIDLICANGRQSYSIGTGGVYKYGQVLDLVNRYIWRNLGTVSGTDEWGARCGGRIVFNDRIVTRTAGESGWAETLGNVPATVRVYADPEIANSITKFTILATSVGGLEYRVRGSGSQSIDIRMNDEGFGVFEDSGNRSLASSVGSLVSGTNAAGLIQYIGSSPVGNWEIIVDSSGETLTSNNEKIVIKKDGVLQFVYSGPLNRVNAGHAYLTLRPGMKLDDFSYERAD